MESNRNVAPHVDFFARAICLAVGAVLGTCAYFNFIGAGFDVVFWLAGIPAAILIFAAIFGPRAIRIGLVAWLPWF